MGLFDKLKKKTNEKASKIEGGVEVVKPKIEATKKKKEIAIEGKKAFHHAQNDKKNNEETTIANKTVKKVGQTNAYSVLIKTLVSEKAAGAEMISAYTFVVLNKATKLEIKKAVKDVYGIMPVKVRIINVEGKKASSQFKQGRRSDWKKAIVVLPKGKTINIHEGV